jgi:multidrug efflux system membrane fusion protein
MEFEMPVAHLPVSVLRAVFVVLSLPVILGACKPEAKPVPQPRAVNVVKVGEADTLFGNRYSGDVRARYETALGFRVGGKITERLVEVGDTVRKGQVLLRLDPVDRKLSVDAAGQQVAAAESNHRQAKAEFQRFEGLYRQGFISAAEFDRRKSAFEVAAAQLAQARSQWTFDRNQADYTTLRADHDGVVTVLQAEVGQVVDTGTPVVRVVRPGEKEVAIAVPESRLADVRRGSEADIVLWADPSKSYKGRVREIAPNADQVTRTYTAKVTMLDADERVQWGMTATVALSGGAAGARAIRLPSSAIYQKGDQAAVWVVDPANGQVNLRPVKLDRFADEYVTILDGVRPGENVVRAGVHKLFAGEKVRVLAGAAR